MTRHESDTSSEEPRGGSRDSGQSPALQFSEALTVLADAGRRASGVMSSEGALREACSILLDAALSTTGAEYGFCGQCRYDEVTGQPYLFSLALTNIAWNEETAKIYAKFLSEGLEFRALDSLYGAVLTSKRLLLTRDARRHPRAGGTPHGHPALERFIGIPVLTGEKLVGMIGVANFDDHLSNEELSDRAELIAMASAGSFALAQSSEIAEIHRRVSRHNHFDLLQRVIGGFAHEFNNDLMCLTMGLPLIARSASEAAEHTELWGEVIHSVERMKHEVRSLNRFVAMTQSELALPSLCQLAGQLIELLTLCPTTVEHEDMSDLFLSVPEPIVMTWLMEAIFALRSADTSAETRPIYLRTRANRVGELFVDFEIEGNFALIPAKEAMTSLLDDCRRLGAEVSYTFPQLRLCIPAHQIVH